MLFRPRISTLIALSAAVVQGQGVSNECLSETNTVNDDANVMNVAKQVINGTLSIKDPLACGGSSTTVTCSYDYAQAETNFDTACDAAGGQVFDTSFQINCDVNGASITYQFNDVPSCIGTSCNTTIYTNEQKNITDDFAMELNNIEGVSGCTSKLASGAIPSPSMTTTAALLVAGGSFMVSMFM